MREAVKRVKRLLRRRLRPAVRRRMRSVRTVAKPFVPRRLRPAARKIYYFPADALDSVLGRRGALVPPKGSIFVGRGDFERTGNRFFRHFLDLGGLRPDEHVLEVGCGLGRMAVPLMSYLSSSGRYEGFDVVPQAIRWCQKNITPRHSNFRFRVAEDIYNKEYNPAGKLRASEYKFPYEDESFDFVILTSVFTHMLPEEVTNYLSEIKRVMKTGGRSLNTFFLLNQESLELIESGRSLVEFKYDFGAYRVKEKDTPEAAITYQESFIRKLHEENQLEIAEPIHYGRWCGREDSLEYLDIVVARKLSPS
jgi:ubiquinone/menaquinone biosynthesis C-methylase UbiE